MYIGKNYIYFELRKTASSQVRKILKRVESLPFKKVGIHNAYFEVPKRELDNFEAKIKIGSVRNPWDWYVSLWTWCCTGNGIYKNLLMPRNGMGLQFFLRHPFLFIANRKKWKEVCSDSTNYDNFKKWLKMMLVDKQYEIGDGYASGALAPHVGYLTFCYLRLHVRDFQVLEKRVTQYADVVKMDRDNNFINHIIRSEYFDADMERALTALGVPTQDIQTIFKLTEGRANATKRDDYHVYYDEKSRGLVAEKERLIIEKYQYAY